MFVLLMLCDVQACYDVRESSYFWHVMALTAELREDNTEQVPQWLSTHPNYSSRAGNLDARIPEVHACLQIHAHLCHCCSKVVSLCH